MQTQTEQLLEKIEAFAGIWVSVNDRLPQYDGRYICRTINEVPFISIFMGYERNSWRNEVFEPSYWLDPSPEIKEQLKLLLQQKKEEELSDQQSAINYTTSSIVGLYSDSKDSGERIAFAMVSNAYYDGRQSLRSQYTAEIKALEEKVKERENLLFDCQVFLESAKSFYLKHKQRLTYGLINEILGKFKKLQSDNQLQQS